MPFLNWGVRRQLAVFAIFAVFVFLIVFGVIYYFQPAPSCFDNVKNQDEEGIDCGGEIARCVPCSEKIHNLSVLWTRIFSVRSGSYDLAAMLNNQNQFSGSKKLVYAVKIYDKNNVLIAIRENSTFVGAGEKFIIFEPDFSIQNRIPARANLELRSIIWESQEPRPLPVDILNKNLLSNSVPATLNAKIKNKSTDIIKNIEATAVLFDKDGNAVGASRTALNTLGISAEADLVFTWPEAMAQAANAQIFLRKAE